MFHARRLDTMRTGIVCSLVLAFLALVASGLYADLPLMLAALAHVQWGVLLLLLSLTLCDDGVRFARWQNYLRRLQMALEWRTSVLMFLSSLARAMKPGKVGALLTPYLLKRSTGEPISRTAPISEAERLADGLAMLLLAASALVFYRFGGEILLALLIASLGLILLIRFYTLWFGLALGVGALLVLRLTQHRSLCAPETHEEEKALVYATSDSDATRNSTQGALSLSRDRHL
jgi:uncharacterized membrane protein YbhN (UPF0104 family)